jgi:hypothetical protein
MRDLGAIGSIPLSLGYGINDWGAGGGWIEWKCVSISRGPNAGSQDLVDPALELTLNEATAINDHGQIVANNAASTDGLPPHPDSQRAGA